MPLFLYLVTITIVLLSGMLTGSCLLPYDFLNTFEVLISGGGSDSGHISTSAYILEIFQCIYVALIVSTLPVLLINILNLFLDQCQRQRTRYFSCFQWHQLSCNISSGLFYLYVLLDPVLDIPSYSICS